MRSPFAKAGAREVAAPVEALDESHQAPPSVESQSQSEDLSEKPAEAPKPDEEEIEYPQGLKLALILTSMYLAVFLSALDRTIISVAIPRITDEFNSFGDVGWYGSAFLLTISAFQLLIGRIYTFYSPKWVFIVCIVIFEIGSAVCGAAPNSVALIVGRAIAGLGSAGIVSGAIILLVYAAPLHKRPFYQGFFGAVFGVASVAGPLLGGVFTTKVSWRWCFYINLPIGAVTILFLFLFLKTPVQVDAGLSLKQQLGKLDPIGSTVFVPGMVCVLLALQWGGSTYAWSDSRIIALLVLFGVLMICFVGIQLWKKENATVPPHIIGQRSITSGVLFNFCTGAHMLVVVYYLPIWFQAIKGYTAVHSGIAILPMLLSLVVASILNGIMVSKMGYYVPSMIFAVVACSVAAGILSTFEISTGSPEWIGIQVLYGFGLGAGMQQAGLAAQTVLARKDVPSGVSVTMFAQGFGGTLSISIGQNILNNRLISGLSKIQGFDPSDVVDNGATELRGAFPARYLQQVLVTYNSALTNIFYLAVAFAALSVIGASTMEWRSVKKGKQQKH